MGTTLIFIILALVGFSFIINAFPKYYKSFAVLVILLIISIYFFHIKHSVFTYHFSPGKSPAVSAYTGNYYNLLVMAFKDKRLHFATDDDFPVLKQPDVYHALLDMNYNQPHTWLLYETSYYKGKIYLYFGLSPVLLFYLPFNLLTGLYMTDKLMLFLLMSGVFLLTLKIVKMLAPKMTNGKKIPLYIKVLSTILIGFCGGQLFVLMKASTYEIAAMCMMFLFLLSLFFFIKYAYDEKGAGKYYLFFAGLFLAFSAGSKPYMAVYVPFFTAAVFIIEYYRKADKKQKTTLKKTIKACAIFLAPCILYGILLATYNYLRFESIFQFGVKYQLNNANLYDATLHIKDLFLGIKYYIFSAPGFSLNANFPLMRMAIAGGHSVCNEEAVGAVFFFPLIVFSLIMLPKTFVNIKKNKEIMVLLGLLICVVIGNLLVVSLIAGLARRYIFEILYIGVIASLLIFYHIYANATKEKIKKWLGAFFVAVFVITMYIEISLLASYLFIEQNLYIKIIKFLS